MLQSAGLSAIRPKPQMAGNASAAVYPLSMETLSTPAARGLHEHRGPCTTDGWWSGDDDDEDNLEDSEPTMSSVLFDYTCLLYTSPSPRDRTRSRMPSSA
eukprot:TRINITY_DN4875_c0_g1_i1.p1 TRINITY_DN4875_c0_g1~~TRINITY_DN4875_c0_g1_i1.p1  ORF type:complete len:100 (-),score=30.22 TRINITY_DN4875_c0_g1_i1:25-324(-)